LTVHSGTREGPVPNLVCFSGNRAGMPDEEGLENCARGRRQIAPHAERKDTGFLAQEFVPTDEPLRALTEAFRICDV